MRRLMVVALAGVVWFCTGCATLSSAHLNEQNRQAGVVVKEHGAALQTVDDEVIQAVGAELVQVGGDIEKNSAMLKETTFPNFDVSETPGYSAEASERLREEAKKEAESGGILGVILGAVETKVPAVGWVVGFVGGLIAWWQRKRGTRTGKALDATISGIAQFAAGEVEAGKALKKIVNNEHVKAAAMDVVTPRIEAVELRIEKKLEEIKAAVTG